MSNNDIKQYFNTNYWKDYELLDTGDFEKLERFGNYVLSRPEPQAIWSKSLSANDWDKYSNAKFILSQQHDKEDGGKWIFTKKIPENWDITYTYEKLNIKLRLGFNSFKHIGVFPEQAENWNYIYNFCRNNNTKQLKILNLFAYTGAGSIAALANNNAKVVHVDAVKNVVNWAKINAELSGFKNISLVVEDAYKFVQREVKRGNKYDAIILDPPAFGRGPNGEKWILQKNLNELLNLCALLLNETESCFILNLYSLGLSPLISENLIKQHFKLENYEFGENYITDKFNKKLPLGTFIRFVK